MTDYLLFSPRRRTRVYVAATSSCSARQWGYEGKLSITQVRTAIISDFFISHSSEKKRTLRLIYLDRELATAKSNFSGNLFS